MNTPQAVPTSSPFRFGRMLSYWLPPILWMGAIFFFSTDVFSASNTGGLIETVSRWLYPALTLEQLGWVHFLVRKAAHLTVYAILALLVLRAFRAGSPVRWKRSRVIYTFFVVSIYALLDEYHQTFTSLRSGTPYDSFIDMTGGAIALFASWLVSRRRRA